MQWDWYSELKVLKWGNPHEAVGERLRRVMIWDDFNGIKFGAGSQPAETSQGPASLVRWGAHELKRVTLTKAFCRFLLYKFYFGFC